MTNLLFKLALSGLNAGSQTGYLTSKSIPSGLNHLELEFPFRKFQPVIYTSEEDHLVCYGFEKMKHTLFIYSSKTGQLVATMVVKYTGFKEVLKIVALPDKPGVVALIDAEKGNLIDVVNRKFLRSISSWDGSYTKDGRFGLHAPPSGGMDILDLRTGCRFF